MYRFILALLLFLALTANANAQDWQLNVDGVVLSPSNKLLTLTGNAGPYWRPTVRDHNFMDWTGTRYIYFETAVSGSFLLGAPGAPQGSELALFRMTDSGDANYVSTKLGAFAVPDKTKQFYLTPGSYVVRATIGQMATPHVLFDFFPDNDTGQAIDLNPGLPDSAAMSWLPAYYKKEVESWIDSAFNNAALRIGAVSGVMFEQTARNKFFDDSIDALFLYEDSLGLDYVDYGEILAKKAGQQLRYDNDPDGDSLVWNAYDTALQHLLLMDDMVALAAGDLSGLRSILQQAASDAATIGTTLGGAMAIDYHFERATEAFLARILLEAYLYQYKGDWSNFSRQFLGRTDGTLEEICAAAAELYGQDNFLFFDNRYDFDKVHDFFYLAVNGITDWLPIRRTMANPYPDVDGDGHTNLDEIADGTDPNDPGDPPPPPPPGTPYAVITASPSSCKIMDTVSLSGADSTGGNGRTIQSYAWELVGPTGSSPTLASASGATTSFVPRTVGTYTVKLTINDGTSTVSATRQVVVRTSYPNITEVFDDDGRHIYIEDLDVPKCVGQNITQIGGFTVPAGEKWTSIHFAASQGDVVLIARKNARPEWRSGYCGAWEFRGEEYDWYDGTRIYTWSDDLVPGDTLYLAAVSYDAEDNFSINTKVYVTYDMDGDGVPDDREAVPFRDDPSEQFDSDNDGVGDNADKFDNDPAASMDGDNDGYPTSWNAGKTTADSTTGLVLDAFPTDPAAGLDSDGDGHPDCWNKGKTEANSTTGLTLDAFPDDPAASADSDGDGRPGGWNPGKSAGDSTTGLTLDAFPDDPAASVDTDGDGYPDGWNTGMSAGDSTTGLVLDAFPDDPAAAVDSDRDGVPDAWLAGMTAADSTTKLSLDAFPDDPTEQADSDGDNVGDNADAAPADATRSSNAPPVIAAIADQAVSANLAVSIPVTASDPDGDETTLHVVAGSQYATYHDGRITLLASDAVDSFRVALLATDVYGSTASAAFLVTVTPDLSACDFTLSPASATFGRAGGAGTVTIRSDAYCPWTASASTDWVSISSATEGTGNSVLTYTVGSAPDDAQRTAVITVGGRSVAIVQNRAAATAFPAAVINLLLSDDTTSIQDEDFGTGLGRTPQ